jgi:hypothetical protein
MTYQAIGLERMIEAAEPVPHPAPMIPLRWLALATACCGAVVVGLLVRNRLTVDWLDPAMLALMGVIVAGGAALCHARCFHPGAAPRARYRRLLAADVLHGNGGRLCLLCGGVQHIGLCGCRAGAWRQAAAFRLGGLL